MDPMISLQGGVQRISPALSQMNLVGKEIIPALREGTRSLMYSGFFTDNNLPSSEKWNFCKNKQSASEETKVFVYAVKSLTRITYEQIFTRIAGGKPAKLTQAQIDRFLYSHLEKYLSQEEGIYQGDINFLFSEYDGGEERLLVASVYFHLFGERLVFQEIDDFLEQREGFTNYLVIPV